MMEKIQEVYNKIKHKYSSEKNNEKIRLLLKTELSYELGDSFEVKVDEENNPPAISDLNCLVAKIIWDKERNGNYKYVNLIFGDETNIEQVNFLLN